MNRRENHRIQLREGIPVGMTAAAAELYVEVLADKLVPVFGSGDRAIRALASGLNRQMCLAAVEGETLVGVLGIQTAAAGFVDVPWRSLRASYGFFGSLWRLALLAWLHHEPLDGEAYIDGVAVASAWRGRGVGSRLITALERWAAERGLDTLCLEVIDTNVRVQRLYRRLGFMTVSNQTVWPLGSLFGFRSSAVMVKLLD